MSKTEEKKVEVFIHSSQLNEDVKPVVEYLEKSMNTYGFDLNSYFDIHVWNEEKFCHIEIGRRVNNCMNSDMDVAEAIIVIVIKREPDFRISLFYPKCGSRHDDIERFVKDTERILSETFSCNNFEYFHIDELKLNFFGFESMLLDEKGQRITEKGEIVSESGYQAHGFDDFSLAEMFA